MDSVWVLDGRVDQMKWKRKGYLTVEASFILSMAVIVTGLMLSLGFYVCQRCWCTQAACEIVLSGSSRGILKGSSPLQEAEWKSEILKKEWYLQPEKISFSTDGDEDEVHHRITGTIPVWGTRTLKIEAQASQKVVRPVVFILKANKASAILQRHT